MQIAKATSSDATIIALLARITFSETFSHYFSDKTDLENYLDHTFNVEKLKNSLTKPNNVYWLAYIDGLPVGYAKLKLNSPSPFIEAQDVCQLQKIYVLKDFLSKKVGLALQNELLEEAASKSEKIWLSVLKENTRAIRFYEKNGFDKIGDHDFQIGKEHFKFQAMSKSLQ
ncbi:N-acetyltransferase family protein [Flagellimonas sp. 2504JD4-2]